MGDPSAWVHDDCVFAAGDMNMEHQQYYKARHPRPHRDEGGTGRGKLKNCINLRAIPVRPVGQMTYYDPSSRVPCIITGPHIQAGAVYKNLTAHLDLFPTFLEWAQVGPGPRASLMPLAPTTRRPQPLLVLLGTVRRFQCHRKPCWRAARWFPSWSTAWILAG